MDFNPLSSLSSFLSPSTTAETRPPLSTPPYQADSRAQTPITEGGLTFAKGTKGVAGDFGTLAYDPEQSASILANLEKFRDQRIKLANPSDMEEGGFNAVAWGQTYPGGRGLQDLEAHRTKKSEMLKDAFDAQMQIEQFKASQKNQQREALQKAQILGNMGVGAGGVGAGAGGVGVGGAGGVGVGGAGAGGQGAPMSKEMAIALINAKPGEEFNKLYADWAKSYDENEHKWATNPETYKQFDYYDGNGKLQRYSPDDIRKFKPVIDAARYRRNPDPEANVLPIERNPILEGLHEAVIGQESSGGKADTSKPNLQGAIGPGQFLPGTWKQYQDQKIIPEEWDINNPDQNKAATRLLLGHYYDKYNGDINKVLAAYHGGEGSINKDGSINLGAKDALGVSNQQYIDQVKAKIPGSFTNEPATKVAGNGKSFGEFQVEQKGKEERVSREASVIGEEVAKRRIVLETASKDADSNLANIKTINNLALTHPKAFGVLQHPTVLSAIGDMFKSGIQDGTIGTHHISAIEDAIRKASPGMKEEDITAAQEAVSKLAQLELNAAKVYLKGQGAVSDAERALISKLTGSISNSPQALADIMKWNEIHALYDKEIGSHYKEWKKSNKGASFEEFEDSDLYKSTKQKYAKQMDELAATAGKYAGSSNPATTKPAPTPPPGYNPNWRSFIKGIAGGNQ